MSQPHSAILNIIQSLINGRSVWPLRRMAKKRIPGSLSKKRGSFVGFLRLGSIFRRTNHREAFFTQSIMAIWLSQLKTPC